MGRNARFGITLCVAAILAGCMPLFVSHWVAVGSESGLRGAMSTATKDFTVDGNARLVRLLVSCRPTVSDVTVSLESYDAVGSDKEYLPSTLLTDDEGAMKGRVQWHGADGTATTHALTELFAMSRYNNVAAFDVALFSAAAWLSNDEDVFRIWAARHAPERGETSVDAFAQAMKQPAAGMTLFAEAQLLEGGPEAEDVKRVLATIVSGGVLNGRQQHALSTLGSGATMKRMLPMTVELFTGGGELELPIASDNDALSGVIDTCAGEPWWSNTAGEMGSQPSAWGWGCLGIAHSSPDPEVQMLAVIVALATAAPVAALASKPPSRIQGTRR
jgi:hypothetical protein